MKKWTGAASLLLAVAACDNPPTPPTAPLAPETPKVAVPGAGPMSTQGPVAGRLSVRSPEAGPMSVESPQMETGAVQFEAPRNATAAIVAPAMRLLWQNTSTGDRSIWIMNGVAWDGSYALLPSVVTAWSMAASGDFNADGNSDIVWQNTATGDRSIWFMNNTTWGGSFALLPNVALAWSIAGAGDFNNDGKPDLVWQNTTTGDRSIWFMNGSTWGGSFALLPNVAPAWRIAGVADFNADNKPDLVWQNVATGQRSIWFMNGSTWTGTFALLPTVATDWRIAGAADFDGDNKPDLVWQNLTTGQRSIWIMNGATWDGSFSLLPTIATAWSIAGTLAPPVAPTFPFASITAGGIHTCGLTSGGTAYCWGNNDYGQLGDGTSGTNRLTPTAVAGGLSFTSLALGLYHTCGLTSGGAAYCWGNNQSGQLGDGTSGTNRLAPTAVAGGLTFASIAAGQAHTCGLTSGGAAYCWGYNGYGGLGDGTTTNRLTPTPVAGGLSFTSLALGSYHTCGLTSGGAGYCWGFNGYGQLGDGTSGTNRLAPTAVAGGLTFARITAGQAHTCGLTSGGAAYCWGYNNTGQLGDGTSGTNRLTPTPVASP